MSNETRGFALSYRHKEHDFGKLSHEQANELRRVLTKLVSTGPSKSVLLGRQYVHDTGGDGPPGF